MQTSKFGNALVVGKRSPNVNEIMRILSEHFLKVNRISGSADSIESYPSYHFHLIVVTDSLDHMLDKDYVADLRKKFPQVVPSLQIQNNEIFER